MLVPAWERLLAAEPELAEMFADGGEGGPDARPPGWTRAAPCSTATSPWRTRRRLEPAERELYVETLLDSRLLLRGFVDRLDVAPDGALRVVDYKTGGAPRREVRGQGAVPDEVLRARASGAPAASCRRCCSWSTSATARSCATCPTRPTCSPPSARSRRSGRRSGAAEESGDWRPSPGRLCDWCAHQALCPAFGRHAAAAAGARRGRGSTTRRTSPVAPVTRGSDRPQP